MPSPARPKPAPRPARRRPEDARRACKPDFVHRLRGWMTIPLVRPLPDGSSCLPGSAGARWPCGLRRARSLFGIAPGGACHAGAVASPPVGSYPTVSPLPIRRQAVCSLWRYPWGCPRRALPGTITSWSPDFPRQVAPPRSSSPPRAVGMAGIGRRVNGRSGGWNGRDQVGSRLAAMRRSSSVSGPCAQGRNRSRKAAKRLAGSTSG